jgi:hypothetical protein
MKPYIKQYFLVFLFALSFYSCQDESVEIISPDEQETLVANSTLSNLMLRTSANSVASDNILDNSNCFSVDLPVTVVVSDITITITTEDDLEELEDLLEDFQGQLPEFVFPITIIYSDYEEQVIENQDQLQALLEQCFDDDDIIECVDFVYPISFSVFNTEFVILDTINIENSEALYDFLERLEDESEALIVGLNFPVTLEYANGDTVNVTTNQELASAIESAGDDCEDDGYVTCSVDDIKSFLMECSWLMDGVFDDLEITFNEDFTLTIEGASLPNPVTGNWDVDETSNGTYITFLNLSAFQNDLGGQWLITECEYDDFEIVRGDIDIDLDRNCETDINCSAQDISENLRECTWFANSNLLSDGQTHKFKFTENYNVMYYSESTNEFINVGTWQVVIDGMTRKVQFNLIQPLAQLSGLWTVTECNDEYFSFQNGENTFEIEKECFDNLFECYDDATYQLTSCDYDGDGVAKFNIYEAVPSCTSDFTQAISFHLSLAGAETQTDNLSDAINFNNTESNQTIYIRVQINNGQDTFQVYPVELNVEDCSTPCSVQNVNDYLIDCKWNIVSVDGNGTNLIIYDFGFNADGVVLITNTSNNEVEEANWAILTDPSTGRIILGFTNINNNALSVIFGNSGLVACDVDRLEFQNNGSGSIFVMEKDCN